LHKTEPEMKMV